MSDTGIRFGYLDVSAQRIIDLVKEKCDIPQDSKVIHVTLNPDIRGWPYVSGDPIRFYVESNELDLVEEGACCKEIKAVCQDKELEDEVTK